MESLLDLVKQSLTSEVVGKVAGLIGESPDATSKVVGAAAPALLSAIASKGNTSEGAGQLLALMKDNKVDANMAGNVLGMLDGGLQTTGMMSNGNAILNGLLGSGKANGLADAIGAMTGVKSQGAHTLMSMLMPIIGSVILKKLGVNPNAAGLLSLLGSQSGLGNMVPSALQSVLGLGGMAGAAAQGAAGAVRDVSGNVSRGVSNAVDDAAHKTTSAVSGAARGASNAADSVARGAVNTTTTAVQKASGGLPGWLIPALLALVALAAIVFFVLPALTGGNTAQLRTTACTAYNTGNTTFGSLPAITENTQKSDLVAWLAKNDSTITGLANAAKAVPGVNAATIDSLVNQYTQLKNAINGVQGATLGTAATAINTQVNALKTSFGGMKAVIGCN